jgi:hypothetical protein
MKLIQILNNYRIGKTNSQYCAGFYIVALPAIYNHCHGNSVGQEEGPFDWYFDKLQRYGKLIGLSFEYQQLAKGGLRLFNNHKHDESCDDFSLFLSVSKWSQDLFNVFIQACKIKRSFAVVKARL